MHATIRDHRSVVLALCCWGCGLPVAVWPIRYTPLPGIEAPRWCSLRCAELGERDYPTLAR